jgi:aspartate aminotransferase
LEALKQLVIKYDLFLLADEVYREFCYDGKEYVSIFHLEGIDNNVILLDSISKRYSACGARIGAFITKNKEVISAALKFAQARLSPPTFGQIGAEAALDTPKEYFDAVNKEYTGRRNFLVNELNKIPGVHCPMPGGAFYCIAKLPVDDTDVFCQWLLENFSFEGQTVMMAPASGFYSSAGKGKDEVRLAYVLKKEDLEKAIVCLREALKIYPGTKNTETTEKRRA